MIDRDARKVRISGLAAPALLVAVALLQIHCVKVYDLTAWKGGGFGMFSTVDSQAARFLRIHAATEFGRMPVQVPANLSALALEVRTIPTPDRIARLKSALLLQQWTWAEGSEDVGSGASPGPGMDDAQRPGASGEAMAGLLHAVEAGEPTPGSLVLVADIELDVLRYGFDPDALTLWVTAVSD